MTKSAGMIVTLMKASSLFAIALLIALMTMGSAVLVLGQTVQKQTVTKDFGDYAYVNSAGTNVFAYDIIQSYQAEPNGSGWISGNSYQANWTIRLDYVNQSIVNESSYIEFYLPPSNGSYFETIMHGFPPVNESVGVAVEALTNQTRLSPEQKTGTLSATFSVENDSEGFIQNFNLPFAIYCNGEIIYSGLTFQGCNLSSEAVSSQSSSQASDVLSDAPEFPTSAFVPATIIALTASIAVLTIIRRRKITAKTKAML